MQKVLLINPEESRTIWTLSGIIDDEPLDLEMIYTELKNNNIDLTLYLLSTYSNSDSYKYISYKELAISEEKLEYIVSLYTEYLTKKS